MNETSKALIRRLNDARYANTYFAGNGIDIGAGDDSLGKYKQQFPLMTEVRAWDLPDGDAQEMATVEDNTYDFVHSSHCLEHMVNPYQAYKNWLRICKPGGHIITTIPDEDLYEQGVFPSTFNNDHKSTWTILKEKSWSPVSINVLELVYQFRSEIEVLKMELINGAFNYNLPRIDQTYHSISECAIEFIVRKRPADEIERLGRLPK
jgi:ubiquinone/menaquinone biosynthesis C-methylase UbiE